MHHTLRPLLLSALCLAALLFATLSATAQESVVEVPLRYHDGFLTVTVVAPDGTELDFGIATASPPTAVSEGVVERFGEAAALSLGGLPLPAARETWPAGRLAGPEGDPVDGVLGAAFLSDHEILVDVPGERLLLRSVGPAAGWEGVELSEPTSIQILHGSVVSLSSTVNGSAFFTMLDLSTRPSIFSPAVGERLGLETDGAAAVAIGSTELPGQPYGVRDLEVFRRFDPAGNGFVILGAPIARDCAIAISWARGEIRTCNR